MKQRIVCFGDSLTACGGENGRFSDILQDRFPDFEFVNRGVGGETFQDALARVDQDVVALRPSVVLIEFGANDWWKNERHHIDWASDLERLIVRVKHAGARPVVLGVFGDFLDDDGARRPKIYGTDERALAYRNLEALMAARHKCDYIANIQERIIGNRCCWLDRNHPNEMGNRFVADTIEPVLARLLGTDARPVRKPTLRTTRDFWDEAVALAPDHTAVVDKGLRMTYADADAHVRGLAAGIDRATGGASQPKIAVYLPNCLEYFLLYWAAARLGGIIVPLNTWLRKDSIEAIFRTVRPDLLVVGGPRDSECLEAAREADVKAVYALDPAGSGLRACEALLLEGASGPHPEIAPDAPSIIMHTSGTTAAPKGAVMRHSDLMFNDMTTINAHQFRPSDVHLLVNPMFHCTALYSSLPTAAYQKSTVVITADTFPNALMQLVQDERITTFLSIPSIFQRITALPNLADFDASSLRLIAYAGSMMPVGTILELQRLFPGVELHNFFGLTETISMTHVLSGQDAMTRPDSIGRLLPFVSSRVVDAQMKEVAPGTVGELLFARENVIPGYYNQPGKLEESFVEIDGKPWFRTGDLAMVDEEGYFFVKGRQKDMIIVGGENVYAAEVEGVLMGHPKVKEAAVKGVPATGVRKALGELIKAYVVPLDPSLTETDIKRHCHERLASYKVPHLVQFMDALPRNPSGKVVKAELP